METNIIGGTGDGAYRWEPPISDYSKVDELQFKQISSIIKKQTNFSNWLRTFSAIYLK